MYQLGPTVALGARLGPIIGEVDYAYLSFMEADVSSSGMHRVGVNLRAELLRDERRACRMLLPCTRAVTLYGEIGAGLRLGQWHLDATRRFPAGSDRQREAHVGVGLQLDNRVWPTRYGAQLGLRLAIAPRDDLMVACRGVSCASVPGAMSTGQLDRTYLFEWTFLIGR